MRLCLPNAYVQHVLMAFHAAGANQLLDGPEGARDNRRGQARHARRPRITARNPLRPGVQTPWAGGGRWPGEGMARRGRFGWRISWPWTRYGGGGWSFRIGGRPFRNDRLRLPNGLRSFDGWQSVIAEWVTLDGRLTIRNGRLTIRSCGSTIWNRRLTIRSCGLTIRDHGLPIRCWHGPAWRQLVAGNCCRSVVFFRLATWKILPRGSRCQRRRRVSHEGAKRKLWERGPAARV